MGKVYHSEEWWTSVPINQHLLGNDDCMVRLSSGQVVVLPPMMNNIADALYWIQN
jgi:hypothetical protein